MVAIRFQKLEVVLSQPWIEIFHRNQFNFRLLNQNPEDDFRLYGCYLDNSIRRHKSATNRVITTTFGRQVQSDISIHVKIETGSGILL